MSRCLRSLLYLCVVLIVADASQHEALASPARRSITASYICYPVVIPFCDYSHRPPAIYNTPCGLWPYW
jgi:hypothetical protein